MRDVGLVLVDTSDVGIVVTHGTLGDIAQTHEATEEMYARCVSRFGTSLRGNFSGDICQ